MEDRIDVYIDLNNRDNLWGMVTYYEKVKHIVRERNDLIHFANNDSMNRFVHSYFHSDKINYHFIDYSCIEYHYYEGKPKRNHIEIKYYEYVKNVRTPKTIKLPPELESKFINIFKISKNVPYFQQLDVKYRRDVDEKEERREKNRERAQVVRMTLTNQKN